MRAALRVIQAAMIVDARSVAAAPGALLLDGRRVIAAGPPQAVGTPAGAAVERRPEAVLLPGLVNAHCHLDLSHLGSMPYTGQFVTWAETIRQRRAATNAEIAAAVGRGIDLSLAGGTAIVGDIAGNGSQIPIDALRGSPLTGVAFLEVFGAGVRQARAIDRMREAVKTIPACAAGIRLGLQPHAPYSCGLNVYRAAAALGLPLATHLAETPEELRFVRDGDGPLAEMLKRIGVWDDTIVGLGCHPIDALAEVLSATPFLAAHVNYLQDQHLSRLRHWRLTVAYCPRASAYFGHGRGEGPAHQYRAMLEAGVNVALGTDSLLCLDTPERLSVLDDIRLLYRRDGTDPRQLLAMATVNGATALGLDPSLVTFEPGPVAGVIAIEAVGSAGLTDPLAQVLDGDDAPSWLLAPGNAGGAMR